MATQLQQSNQHPWNLRETGLLLAVLLLSAVVLVLLLRPVSLPPQAPAAACVPTCPVPAKPLQVSEKPLLSEHACDYELGSEPTKASLKPVAVTTKTTIPSIPGKNPSAEHKSGAARVPRNTAPSVPPPAQPPQPSPGSEIGKAYRGSHEIDSRADWHRK